MKNILTLLFIYFFVGFIYPQEQTLQIVNKPVPGKFKHISVPEDKIVFIIKAPQTIKIINEDLGENHFQLLEKLNDDYYKYTFLYSGSKSGNLWIQMGNSYTLLQYGPHPLAKKNIFFPEKGIKAGDLVYFEISYLKKFFVNVEKLPTMQYSSEGDASVRIIVSPPDFNVKIKPDSNFRYLSSKSDPKKGIYYYLVTPGENRIINISAPGYEPYTIKLNLNKKDSFRITIKETNKSTISIPLKANSQYTKVSIDGKYVGTIPINNYSVKPGKHTIKLDNPDYFADKEIYTVHVGKNEHVSFDKYKFSKYKVVTIRTEPVKGALVYIDGQMQKKRTDMSVKMTKGQHVIRVQKANFNPSTEFIYVSEGTEDIIIKMKRGEYPFRIVSDPPAIVYIDNEKIGKTPVDTELQYGKHKILITAPGYISQRKKIHVDETNNFVSMKLFPSQFTLIGVDVGRSQWGFALTLVYERFMVRGKFHFNYNHNKIDSSDVKLFDAKVPDISSYDQLHGKLISTHNYNFGGSVGYLFSKPVPFVLHGGILYIQPDDYYPVYEAKHSYVDSYNNVVLDKGDLFTYPKEIKPDSYLIYTAGIDFYIKKFLYVGAEYYTDSEVGPGVSFSIGYIQDLNKLFNKVVDAYNSTY